MPVWRDEIGGIATPTSDNERTKISLSTNNLLIIVNAYDGNLQQAQACAEYMQQLLQKYAQSDGGEIVVI